MRNFTRTQMLSLVCGVLMGLTACETPREKQTSADDASKTAEVAKNASARIDTDTLLQLVQTLRDREFSKPPAFEEVDKLPLFKSRGTDAYAAERELLSRVLFGNPDASGMEPALNEWDIARYDAPTNTIRYVGHADAALLRRALIFAIVDGLDRGNFAPPESASTWDEALARKAAQVGTGAFVWIATQAGDRDISPQTLSRRPEIAALLDDVGPRLSVAASTPAALRPREGAFLVREGFTMTAALYRGSKWSSGEFALIDPPDSSLWVVRPDRWLSGEGPGAWSFPEVDANTKALEGLSISREGRVGVALTGIWLSNHLAPGVARSIYTSWQSDAYRFWGDEKRWTFEWVSAWKTPTDALQVAGTLETGLAKLEGAHYEVVTSGTTVAVVGSNTPGLDDHLRAHATTLAGISPIYGVGKKGMISYVPTPIDRYRDGLAEAKLDLDQKSWNDPITGIQMDLNGLAKTWTIQQTQNASARWVARQEGQTILMTTELTDPFAPPFASEAYAAKVTENFNRSFQESKVELSRVDAPMKDTLLVRVTGKFEGAPAVLELRLFEVGDVIVSYSVKATPEKFETAKEDFDKTLAKLAIEPPDDASTDEETNGVIQFKVED